MQKDRGSSMTQTLENEYLKIKVRHKGAELCSLIDKNTGKEYLWEGNPDWWGESSPVLFPFIGGLHNGKYRHCGKDYEMSKHGFARNMDFRLIEKQTDSMWFLLTDTEETKKIYPFAFRLEIGYILIERKLAVKWRVINSGDTRMYFSIGGHPGFVCPPPGQAGVRTDCFLCFDETQQVVSEVIGADGLVSTEKKAYSLEKGMLPVTTGLFDKDALLLAGGQVHAVSLCDSKKKPYLSVLLEAPVVGIWSHEEDRAAFICVEPWYGICDTTGYAGELKDRPFMNMLKAGECFEAGYEIISQSSC